jgi:hypothetical protein
MVGWPQPLPVHGPPLTPPLDLAFFAVLRDTEQLVQEAIVANAHAGTTQSRDHNTLIHGSPTSKAAIIDG